jgi:hypothetical protein
MSSTGQNSYFAGNILTVSSDLERFGCIVWLTVLVGAGGS